MDSPQWTGARVHGDAAEHEFLAVAQTLDPGALLMPDYYPEYDIETFGSKMAMEVKHDVRAAETGNVAVEVAHKGRPSGISSTQATHWALATEG